MGSPYKYKTSFSNEILASSDLEDNQLDLSRASLANLKELLPESIDLDANVDLLAVAFNAAVVNVFNKNHDGISTDTAKAVISYFTHKPTNIEHKKEQVVGHIVSSGFSSFGANEILKEEEIDGLTPFNIALSSVIYKTVNSDFAELIERTTDQEDSMHNAISASWEIGFNDFLIAVGSKNLEDAEIVSDKNQIDELKDYLKAFDGEGLMKDGTEIYRLVCGDVYPLGVGFTTNPAANVKGLLRVEDKKKETDASEKEEVKIEDLPEKIEINTEEFLKKIIKSKKNSSHKQKDAVISNKANLNPTTKKMETKELINELKETIEASASDRFSEEAVANIVKVVTDAIKEKSDLYVQEKAETQKQKEEAETAKAEAEGKLEELQSDLATSQERLEKIEAEVLEAKQLQVFNDRMDSLDSEYDLSDKDRAILVEDLKTLDETDESFASFSEKMKVLFNHKNKEYVAEQEKLFNEKLEAEVQKRLGKSEATEVAQSEERDIEEVLESVESTEDISSNNGDSTEKEVSLKDRFQNAFSKESITIKY
jgi:hypothetical protein